MDINLYGILLTFIGSLVSVAALIYSIIAVKRTDKILEEIKKDTKKIKDHV